MKGLLLSEMEARRWPDFGGDGSGELSLTIKSAVASAIEASIALKTGSSRGPRIKCAAMPAGGGFISKRASRALPWVCPPAVG